jgi:hypothetical protein
VPLTIITDTSKSFSATPEGLSIVKEPTETALLASAKL